MSCSLRTSSSGEGRSATWVRRITAISAAIIAFGAMVISSRTLSNICHIRVRTRIGSASAIRRPRSRSSRPTVGSSAAPGVILMTLTQWATSARSRSTAIGSAPSAYWAESSASAPPASPRRIRSKRSRTRPRSARPSMARTWSAEVSPAPWEMAWSRRLSASRADPSAARTMSASASSLISAPSAVAILRRSASMSSGSIRRRSKRWQRESTVTGTLRISVVARMNLVCPRGSSSVFRSALNALVESMCTSSMMKIL